MYLMDTMAPVQRQGNIVLTGFMGTGKTTTGRLLAKLLDLEFVDADELLAARHGPIPQIFATHGEKGFRSRETAVAVELSQRQGLIISTGGGMMVNPVNVHALASTGQIISLIASVDEIYRRVVSSIRRRERPLLAVPDPKAKIAELYAEREAVYRQFPHIDTDGKAPEIVAKELAKLIQDHRE